MTRQNSTFGSEVSKVFKRAVSSAQNQNRKMGLPNIYMEHGRMRMELPDGRTMAVSKRSLESALKSAKTA